MPANTGCRVLLLVCGLTFLSSANAQVSRKSGPPDPPARQIKITIGFGDRECNPPPRRFCIVIELKCMKEARTSLPQNTAEATVRVVKNQLQLEFSTPPPAGLETITLDEDLSVDECTSRELGYRTLALTKGAYRMQPGGTRFGTLVVNMKGSPLSAPMAP
jgi:hypothetical protein